ncbi:hypothetical protein [Nocardioides sp. AX2bis]|uniref:hypothetical protein n=1 Tax=Nocardioides sp. AX2bis TaxID=2653157 RepID=UPI0012F4023B|nr:hypothetical protein [Nocardioides sp. AX2bis]VXB32801.1 exported hypothetical protein [Nocardioides sp. AX2bis]
MNRTTVRALATPVLAAGLLGGLATVPAHAAEPRNDLYSRADNLTPQRCDASAEGRNTQATGQTGEPVHYSAGSLPVQSVWTTWQAPRSRTVVMNTNGSDFDTVLAVYRGGRLTQLSPIAADDDSGDGLASRVAFDAIRGVTYRIAVDSFGSAEGNYLLRVIC